MKKTFVLSLICFTVACSASSTTTPPAGQPDTDQGQEPDMSEPPAAVSLRVATYNASLYRDEAGQLIQDLQDADSEQPRAIAEIIQRVRPDILLVNEFDYDADGQAAALFQQNFLGVSQEQQEPIEYSFVYIAPSNTGVHSGFDLNRDGQVVSEPGSQDYANDAFGFGRFEGQYAFAIFSRYPLAESELRTFQRFLWKDMPDSQMPRDFYGPEIVEIFRLSSKNHVDLPVQVEGHLLHVLASHPTPPAFDGEERRNQRRNDDEIRLWIDYLTPGNDGYLTDDQGRSGGLAEGAHFVIVGDLNQDPFDGGGLGAIRDLLAHPRVLDPQPTSVGGVQKAEQDGLANDIHRGDPALDTADFSDGVVGNLRVDYVLPSATMTVVDSGVFWPALDDPLYQLSRASDHHLVWVDLVIGDP